MAKPIKSDVYGAGSAIDPTSGVVADIGSLYPRLGTTELWQKTGGAATAWTLLSTSPGFGHVLMVDTVYGNNATAAPSGRPYATVEAAVTDAVAGDLILLFPGTHDLTANLTIPVSVSIQGIDSSTCTLRRLNVTTDAALITMSDLSSLGNLHLHLSSNEHHTLNGIYFPGSTAETVSVRNILIMIDNSGAPLVGTSEINGIHSDGVSSLVASTDTVTNTVVDIRSIGSGDKRGIRVDTNAQQFAIHNVNITMINAGGAGSYIAAETNHVGATLFAHVCTFDGLTADIAQTLGTISLDGTTLENSNANGKGFTAIAYPATFVYADAGATPGGVTRYMRPGTATVSATEIFQRIATQCLAKSFAARAVTGPGAARVDTFTVQKNGVPTSLVVTLTGAQITNINNADSVTFAANDDISIKVVTAGGSTLADIVLTVELY